MDVNTNIFSEPVDLPPYTEYAPYGNILQTSSGSGADPAATWTLWSTTPDLTSTQIGVEPSTSTTFPTTVDAGTTTIATPTSTETGNVVTSSQVALTLAVETVTIKPRKYHHNHHFHHYNMSNQPKGRYVLYHPHALSYCELIISREYTNLSWLRRIK